MPDERLLGRLEEFHKQSEKRFDKIESRFTTIEKKIDALNEFKWRMIGGAVVLSVVLTGLYEILNLVFRMAAAHG